MLDWVRFRLEQFIVRGPFQRLLLMAGIIALIALVGGLIVHASGDFANPREAIWWAFLRLTDPGYLGDDEGVLKRVVSTVITVLGYVVFMGALIAIMTQWFHAVMARIESGTSTASVRDHFVVLGWTNRTAAIVKELVLSETRVRRFYEKLGSGRGLHIVVLCDDDVAEARDELRRELADRYDPEQVIVRHGSPLFPTDLARVDFLRAAALLLPADPTGASHPAQLDAVTIKTLLSTAQAARQLGAQPDELPVIVAELTDERKVAVADRAYGGPIETLSTDRINARLLAQTVRHPGVSAIYTDFLAHSWGNEVYARHWRGDATTFRAVCGSYREALPIGYARGEDFALDIWLNPDLDDKIAFGDRIILLAPEHSATYATTDDGAMEEVEIAAEPPRDPTPPRRNVLVLGWSRKVPAILGEFDLYDDEHFHVDVMAMVPTEDRVRDSQRRIGALRRTAVEHIEGDYTSESDLAAIDLTRYANVILLAGDWLQDDEMADARTLLGYMVVRRALEAEGCDPDIVVELRDGLSATLLHEHGGDVIVSPEMASHMLTHMAMRRELGQVFEELFGPHGAEIFFVGIERYAIEPGRYSFGDIRRVVATRGECALGVRVAGHVTLNPSGTEKFQFQAGDDVVVLAVFRNEAEQRSVSPRPQDPTVVGESQ